MEKYLFLTLKSKAAMCHTGVMTSFIMSYKNMINEVVFLKQHYKVLYHVDTLKVLPQHFILKVRLNYFG